MVTPEDLRYTSLLAFIFSLVIAAVFQFAGLPSLTTWSMILGGVATFFLRWNAVRLSEKQDPLPGKSIQTSQKESSIEDLPEERKQEIQKLVRQELEQIKKEQRADTSPDDTSETLDEDGNEEREFDTETN